VFKDSKIVKEKKCKEISCNNGMKVNSCQDKCTKDLMKCKQNCQWEKINKCWMERLPGNYKEECKEVVENEKFKTCLTGCMRDIPFPTCLNQCKFVQVPSRMKNCYYRLSNINYSLKCSFAKFQKICQGSCKTKQTFKFCGVKDGEEKCYDYSFKGKECVHHCSSRAQTKCYVDRMPYQELREQCKDISNFNSVDVCFKHCFNPTQIHEVEIDVDIQIDDIKKTIDTYNPEIERQATIRDQCCQRADSCCQRELICPETGEKYSEILRNLARRTRNLLRRQERRQETRELFERTRNLQRRKAEQFHKNRHIVP